MDTGNEADIFRLKQRLVDAVKCTLSFYQTNILWPLLVCHPEQKTSALLLLGICNSCELSLYLRRTNVYKREWMSWCKVSCLYKAWKWELFVLSSNAPRNDNNHRGRIAFFPGEAMLALMSVHELCTAAEPSFLDESKQQTILSAIEKSFEFYFNYYYYSEDVDINYNMADPCVLSSTAMYSTMIKRRERVSRSILWTCAKRYTSRSWKHQLFHIGVQVVKQRLDVTGNALSALSKLRCLVLMFFC